MKNIKKVFKGFIFTVLAVVFLVGSFSIGANISHADFETYSIPSFAPYQGNVISTSYPTFNFQVESIQNLTTPLVYPMSCNLIVYITDPFSAPSSFPFTANNADLISMAINTPLPVGSHSWYVVCQDSNSWGISNNNSFTVSSTLSSIAITTQATKHSYNVGDTLDISGLVVTGTYSDASTQVESITNSNVSGFNSASPASSQVLTITYEGHTTAYTVTINAVNRTGNQSVTINAPGTAANNDIIDVPIVANLQNVVGIQFDIHYSDTLLQYDSCASAQIDCVGSYSNVVSLGNGVIRLLWIPDDLNPVTFNNQNLVILHFKVISGTITSTNLIFAPDLEIIDSNINDNTSNVTFNNSGNISLNPPVIQYTLTYTPGANGTISGNLSQTVNQNLNGTAVTAIPNSGFHFVNWSDNSSTDNPRTDVSVQGNISATANFAADEVTPPTTYTLTFDSTGGSAVSPISGITSGTTVTLPTAPTWDGYTFNGWFTATTGGTAFTASTPVTANATVYAEWTANEVTPPTTYTLTYTPGTNGAISGNLSQTVNSGSNGTTVTAIADSGYHFVIWSDSVTTTNRTDTNITSNINVTANFAADIVSGGGGGGGGGGGNYTATNTSPTQTYMIGDINKDGKVDKYDLAILMANWGATGVNIADLNNDNKVDKYDFALLMLNWGK